MKRIVIISAAGALIYFVIWMVLASPYRAIPSDDIKFFYFIEQRGNSQALQSPYPILLISLKVFRKIWSVFSNNSLSVLLFSAVISNSIILFLLSILAYRISENITATIVSIILYGTSAWPANYYFFYSYTPFATMLVFASLFFAIEAHLSEKRRTFFIVLSGSVLGLYLWSSSSAVLMVFLCFSIFLYFNLADLRTNRKNLVVYAISFYSIAAPFISGAYIYVKGALLENIHSAHYLDATQKFGYIPKSPLFSFFYIGGTYNLLLFMYFIFITLFFIIVVFSTKKRRNMEKKEFLQKEKILFILLSIIWIHLVTIDILPFTKLGRTHFVVYPMLILASVGMSYFGIFNYYYKYKKYLLIFILILIVSIVYTNIMFSSKLIYVKTFASKYLSSISQKIQLYTLEDDPHSRPIMTWLKGFNVKEIKIEDLIHKVHSRKGQEIGLIMGPNGIGSGLSIMRHCTLNDFLIKKQYEDYLQGAQRITSLPYYSKFLSFLFEEEVCQALYFEGKVSNSDEILLLIWDNPN